jgi:hypothetical protein
MFEKNIREIDDFNITMLNIVKIMHKQKFINKHHVDLYKNKFVYYKH